MSPYVLCIDPGASGACVQSHLGQPTAVRAFSESVAADVILNFSKAVPDPVALIEKVWASPVMGKSAAFAFGQNYGFWIGALKSHGIPVYAVTPQKWQHVAAPGITATGPARKKQLRELAKRLFPGQRVTAATADALLMTIYAKARLDAGAELGERL